MTLSNNPWLSATSFVPLNLTSLRGLRLFSAQVLARSPSRLLTLWY